MKKPQGALVANVKEGSPAALAGLQSGDVIIKFGEQWVRSVNDLPLLVGNTPIGKKISITVMRFGEEKKLTATIDKLATKGDGNTSTLAKGVKGSLGVLVTALNGDEKHSNALKNGGVKVHRVVPDSPAAKANIESGDIILSVNGASVDSPERLKEIIQKNQTGKPLAILLMRDDRMRFIAVNLDSK